MSPSRERVRAFWQETPCGTADATEPEGTPAFFDQVERQRFEGDDFMPGVVGFDRWAGRDVLEVGCGLGSDLVRFARGGARVAAVDLTERAVSLASRRLELEGLQGRLAVADAERLPLRDGRFDLVYSWGVIHHSPDPPAAAREIVRTCRPGGRCLVMVYHRRSLFAFQVWLVYGLLRGRPFARPRALIATHVESPGTQAYTRREVARLFRGLEGVTVRPIVTRYDVRVGRRRFLPRWARGLVPSWLGWFLVVEGRRPETSGG